MVADEKPLTANQVDPMNKTLKVMLVYLAGAALIAGAVKASMVLADHLSVEMASRKALAQADEVMRRTEETSGQVEVAIRALVLNRSAHACSADEINLMRRLAISASYLQSVGRVDNQRLICSSLGNHTPAIDLGAPDYISDQGNAIRVAVKLPIAPQSHFIVSESQGYAAIVHQELVFDVADYAPETLRGCVRCSRALP
jgi:sensor c-di-GMP phosphodiesterase-like protein